MTGVVRWFDGSKGYGYIDTEDGENVFMHYSAIDGGDFALLSEGKQVVFFLEHNAARGPQATDLTHLS
jgi:CspA family cold shock protein